MSTRPITSTVDRIFDRRVVVNVHFDLWNCINLEWKQVNIETVKFREGIEMEFMLQLCIYIHIYVCELWYDMNIHLQRILSNLSFTVLVRCFRFDFYASYVHQCWCWHHNFFRAFCSWWREPVWWPRGYPCACVFPWKWNRWWCTFWWVWDLLGRRRR